MTDAELTAARDFLVGVFPLRFETPGPVAGSLAGLFVHGLPDDELDRYRGGDRGGHGRRRAAGRARAHPARGGRDRPGRRPRRSSATALDEAGVGPGRGRAATTATSRLAEERLKPSGPALPRER